MRSKPMILFALLLAAWAINLDTTIVNVALPSLTRELGATTTQLQWIVDAYNLVFAALILTAGSLSDRFGRKGMLLGGLAVFGLSSVVGGLTTTPAELIATRAVMGLGAALIFPATLSIIANVFTERRERAQAIGLWGATAGVAVALGPIVGGWLLEHFSWSSIFFVMAPVAAVGAFLVIACVPTSRDPETPPIDLVGFVLSIAAMGLLVFTLIEAPAYGWTATRTLGGFALAAVLLAAFVGWERSVESPMLDIALFRNMRFTAASGAVTVGFFSLFGFIFLMTQYFQFVRNYGPLSTGVHLLPVAMSVAVFSIVGTKAAVRFGTKLVVTLGLLAVAAFYGWVAAIGATVSYGIIAAQMVLYGLGMGLSVSPATESIIGAVSKAKAGVGSAVNDATRLLGGTLGVAVIGSIYASLFGSKLTSTLPHALPASFARVAHESVGAAMAVAGAAGAQGHPAVGDAVRQAATTSFMHGFSVGCLVAGAVAVVGALAAARFLPAQPPTAPEEEPAVELALAG